MTLQGRKALVTGGGSGIGRTIALDLAAEGADVCILDMNEAESISTANAIAALGRQSEVLVCDTGDESVVSAIEALQTSGRFGPIDLLVNNAGTSPKKNDGLKHMVWEISPAEWRQVMNINLNGYFYTMRAILPVMIERKKGAIVNISSLAGRRYSSIAGGAYATSKSAIEGLTRQVAGEVAHFGIRVNGVAPGRIETLMAAKAGAAFNEQIRVATPLGRLGVPTDIANAVSFLLSDKASFITGETLIVSGGRGL
ncbi:SDR family NAD(P)-dependent oxidoreductase [Candidimonas sp. SYP-B2681]|uniref:SDR family NAD(P)-dependent oxidoreductase n=1 Tax=Candidimonas sp. SYP-B2681 TaxID=2497686 RepID=UPI001F2EA995|nr:SDR family NAD(P)-dependent oxidoreductase [Candidimonas sp. SYP-B2681]